MVAPLAWLVRRSLGRAWLQIVSLVGRACVNRGCLLGFVGWILWQLGRHIHDMRRVPEQAAAADSSDEEQSQPGESDEDVDERREIAFQNALDGCEGL
ncbi:hypothetical protein AK812_SmicGene16986 [Symbiodinium microadriaticum]|uniref:Uncharacterized protein n=1 Tax=Symbiodinium microadriaticum TaxID=2951 RepID=A0A1Q9DYZ6_SYMMI|nr:hypothetical protein AK812_SmicGene16986 [Symbiodinium microadriaticum]CAE7855404.1 unnamed protein product [Symbiodinium microadriaticum]CAE7943558.1 unnamed protein product [Symbiodinium sp. KB8]